MQDQKAAGGWPAGAETQARRRRDASSDATAPKAVIGMLTFNRAEYLLEALDSLLSQTYGGFALIVSDDGSTDGTLELLRGYSDRDRRILVHGNERRLGTIGNWRMVFQLAQQYYPRAEYFAWASDHDVWHPRWLAEVVAELDRNRDVVLAYPRNLRISETGRTLREPWEYDTFGLPGTVDRVRRACVHMRAGDMVYGLFRAWVLSQAGVFRPVLFPDRILLAEASLYGQFKQIPKVLWYRRFEGLASMGRQRRNYFPYGAPLYSYLPWWIAHTGALAWTYVARGAGRPAIGRATGLTFTATYALMSVIVELRRWTGRAIDLLPESARGPIRRALRRLLPGLRQ